jgi:hypothetical protein
MSQAKVGLGFLLALTFLVAPVVAWAQGPGRTPQQVPPSPGRGSRTFGPSQSTSHTVQAFQFTGFSATDNTRFDANVFGSRFCSGAGCLFESAVLLPAGAVVTAIELEACDTNPAASVVATLLTQDPLEAGVFLLGSVSTGAAQTPGCAFFLLPLSPQETINNFSNTYQVEVAIDGTTSATRFQAVRIYYLLQVSPPPASATFSDVPTSHPFFQWIEALAAAGITTGCNAFPPMYCPDNPVTRGQMAVFISKALGLQFSP